MRHTPEQPSPGIVFPSSQDSPVSTTPLPHTGPTGPAPPVQPTTQPPPHEPAPPTSKPAPPVEPVLTPPPTLITPPSIDGMPLQARMMSDVTSSSGEMAQRMEESSL